MRFGPNLLEEILRRTDLVQLVGRRVKLTRKGRVMWGCCPFHKEKSASFKVENERRTYKCFGCGAGGDAFKWLMEVEGLTFPESVERLAGEAGVELPKWSPEDEAREEKKKSLYDVVELACAFFEEQLRARAGEQARDYLASRGLNDAVAKQFRLGYAPGGNGALIEHLKAKNIPLDDMIAAGLARAGEGERGPRDFFFNRLMFPISDARGRAIAFGGRALDPDAKPKYINTGETTLFSKGHLLYNFFTARPAALKTGTIVLAEGYMDVIALVRAGFDAAVAPLGTALTEDQLTLLWRTAPEPILAFDGDEAGLRAAHRAARLALPMLNPGFSLRFAFLPGGEDPDSFIRREGAGAMKQVLDAAESLAAVLWRGETEGKDFTTPERRAGLESALTTMIAVVRDPKIAEYYRQDFRERVFKTFKQWEKPVQKSQRAPTDYNRATKTPGGYSRPIVTVSSAVKNSRLALKVTPKALSAEPMGGKVPPSGRVFSHHKRAADGITLAEDRRIYDPSSRLTKELELAGLLLQNPEIAAHQGEVLAGLPLSDPSLDRFRHELLNLAASGFRLENPGLENHLVRTGMAELVERLKARSVTGGDSTQPDPGAEEDVEARWLSAARQLREIAELAPERLRAMERFKSEATEESWREALATRIQPNEG